MTNAYAEWLNEIRQEYGEQLSEMPLPKGLPEHVQELIRNRDEDTILFMLRLAWQLGAQAGFSAGVQLTKQELGAQGAAKSRSSEKSGGLKA